MHEEMRTFGYICPKCGKSVLRGRSVFAIEASNADIPCDCGETRLEIAFDGQQYQLYVPCCICGQTHTAVCPPERLLQGAAAFACSETKQFCCFTGDEGTVEKHLRELAILAEKEKSQQDEAPEAFVDSVIMYEVLSELKEIASRPNGITCRCGHAGYAMEIRRSAVDVICRGCGAKLRIPAATDRDLDDLCCHMTLVIPGGKG